MQELRESIKKMEEDNIYSKKGLFQDTLALKNLHPHNFLSDDISFIKEVQ